MSIKNVKSAPAPIVPVEPVISRVLAPIVQNPVVDRAFRLWDASLSNYNDGSTFKNRLDYLVNGGGMDKSPGRVIPGPVSLKETIDSFEALARLATGLPYSKISSDE